MTKTGRIEKPDWQQLELEPGVLREPSPDVHRIILWVPEDQDGGFRHWERISNVAGADVTVERGTFATAAASVRARQKVQGLFSKLLQPFRRTTGAHTWVLPNGETAEQCGERQTDLLLVWAEEGAGPLEESQVRTCWPEGNRFRKIGRNLFLVAGLEVTGPEGNASLLPQGNPHEQAERLLAAARQAGDRPREAAALTDLGIACHRAGDHQRAAAFLEEAVALARQLGDRTLEGDVLSYLGLAVLGIGQAVPSLQILHEGLTLSRETGNRFQEKLTLEHLGMAYAALREPDQSLMAYEQALMLAREVGDRHHEADLLWHSAVQFAEQGQRDQAIALAQKSLDLFKTMGTPYVDGLADHLEAYRRGDAAGQLGAAGLGLLSGKLAGTGATGAPPGWDARSEPAARGPALLRMAFTAAKSLSKFLGSGLKTVPAATQQKRLGTCATCEHHTGVRCKLCGCFTSVKAWLPHENCPIGKWQG